MTDQPLIAIVGAGIGGLSAGLGLAQAGFRVRVFEQADALGEVGAGLSVPPNATKILSEWGLGAALAGASDTPEAGLIRTGVGGETLSETPFAAPMEAQFGAPYYQLMRPRMHRLLVDALEAAAPGAVRLGAAGARAAPAPGGGAVLRLANGETVEADAVIGADGIRSRLRASLFGEAPARFTGYVAWRATVPMTRLPDRFAASRSVVWVGPGRQFVHYPVDRGRRLNVVAFAGDQTWDLESWTEPADPNELAGVFAGWAEDVQTVLSAIDADACFKWALYDREPLEEWRCGAVALLGDAAHPMLPFLGQGAAMAIEDAYVLAQTLGAASDIEAGLAAYVAARRERAAWVLLESRATGRRFQADAPAGERFGGDRAMRMGVLFGPDPSSLTAGWRAPAEAAHPA